MKTFAKQLEEVTCYEDFARLYNSLLKELFLYSPNQAGSQTFSEKLGVLCDTYPEYEKIYDAAWEGK